MEFLADVRFNDQHILADKLLSNLGYKSYIIKNDGEIFNVKDIVSYMIERNCDSENIVFERINK